jgi:predicted lipid-binding transport protein (Tim44 family)
MFKKISAFLVIFTLTFSSVIDSAMARAGGRSSFGGGRSSTSHFNQGSRGSRTFDSGGANGKNYAPMQKSAKQNQNGANPNNAANAANQQQAQPNRAANFFQRNPFLTTVGAVLAGSWLGHMLFGSAGFGGMASGGGFFINLIMMVLGAFAVMALVRFFTKRSACAAPSGFGNSNFSAGQDNFSNHSQIPAVNISVSNEDKNKFQYLLVDVQKAWSNQDIEALRRLTTPEMLQYFSESLRQNTSQGIANKVEDIDVTTLEIAEAWKEGEMEYATAIIEWSSYDYMINLNKKPNDPDYIVEGGDRNLVMATEAWTFARYGSQGNWILSAIAQVE